MSQQPPGYFMFDGSMEDIVVNNERHEREENDHARLLEHEPDFIRDFAPEDRFEEQEEQMSAIEGGEGEYVDDRKTDA